MSPDITKYIHHLDELDMPEDQKAEFLSALWGYSERVMDLIFGSDPTQLALGLSRINLSSGEGDELELPHTLQSDFKTAAD